MSDINSVDEELDMFFLIISYPSQVGYN